MTPQDQEYTYKPEIGQSGDCQRAVLASLLDLPIKEVPHFLQVAKGMTREGEPNHKTAFHFYGYINDWLEERGYDMQWHRNPIYHPAGTYCQITGPSPNAVGIYHACVGQIQEDGSVKLIHDPHPSKLGLLTTEPWRYSFLVRSDRG